MNKYFTDDDRDQLIYYQVPKVLIIGEKYKPMKPNALKLYIVLLDRMKLSTKNGWKDKKGRYYVRMSKENAPELLGFSDKTFGNMKRELEKYGLLEQARDGEGKSNRLYILKCDYSEEDVYRMNSEVDDVLESEEEKAQTIDNAKKGKSFPSRREKSSPREGKKVPPSKNNYIKNNSNNKNPNPNPNPIDMYEILWNTDLPMKLKQRVKVMIDNQKINLSAEEILLIEDAYHYQISMGFVDPNCSDDYIDALNDTEFTKTIVKMLSTVKDIKNMRGMIKEWVQIALSYKRDQNTPMDLTVDKRKIPLLEWLEEDLNE